MGNFVQKINQDRVVAERERCPSPETAICLGCEIERWYPNCGALPDWDSWTAADGCCRRGRRDRDGRLVGRARRWWRSRVTRAVEDLAMIVASASYRNFVTAAQGGMLSERLVVTWGAQTGTFIQLIVT